MDSGTQRSSLARAVSVVASMLVGAGLCATSSPIAVGVAHPEVVVLNDNGAWSWFEDERAVIDEQSGTLVVSSVASARGSGGAERDGNVEVVTYDLTTGVRHRAVLHPHLQADDHDSAGLYVRRDGRYVAMYSRHAADAITRWRVSEGPDGVRWGGERSYAHGAVVSYSNLYRAVDGRVYAFVRSAGRDPHLLVSDDDGASWRHGGRLLAGPGRPYVRYASDGSGRIHLLVTEQHPLDFPTGIFHGVIDGHGLRSSDGTVVDVDISDDAAVEPDQLTEVYRGDACVRAWAMDVQVDRHGLPYAAFTVHGGPGAQSCAVGNTPRSGYYYARFDGTTWHTHLVADAGSALSATEPYYTGLVALDPGDPGRLVVSTDVDPSTGTPLVSAADGQRHHELFEGTTNDEGATWDWSAVTADSTVDNLRPIIPVSSGSRRVLLWLRGVYNGYTDYDLDVVAVVTDETTAGGGRSAGSLAWIASTATSGPRHRSCRRCWPTCRADRRGGCRSWLHHTSTHDGGTSATWRMLPLARDTAWHRRVTSRGCERRCTSTRTARIATTTRSTIRLLGVNAVASQARPWAQARSSRRGIRRCTAA
jgi:hypothetical protein